MRIAKSRTRVEANTDVDLNWRIDREISRRVDDCAAAGPDAVQRRLGELDDEWDIERAIDLNAAAAVLLGLGLGRFVNRRFYALPGIVAAFLLQHAVQGWCPPVPVLRRLGFRTPREIEKERRALARLATAARGEV